MGSFCEGAVIHLIGQSSLSFLDDIYKISLVLLGGRVIIVSLILCEKIKTQNKLILTQVMAQVSGFGIRVFALNFASGARP